MELTSARAFAPRSPLMLLKKCSVRKALGLVAKSMSCKKEKESTKRNRQQNGGGGRGQQLRHAIRTYGKTYRDG